jgi:hypothetical protein
MHAGEEPVDLGAMGGDVLAQPALAAPVRRHAAGLALALPAPERGLGGQLLGVCAAIGDRRVRGDAAGARRRHPSR